MAAVAGLYRRILPSPPAIEFSSPEGKLLFSEAFHGGTMEGFFKLISYFQTQSEPAYCGLASLAVVLNALAIDPRRKWKGPWRWFDESMLDCCEPLDKIKSEGITFGKVACLAHCSGAKVEAFRTNQSSLHNFREHVISCASSEDNHLITSYTRKAFKQTGTGHFSPIGGYHAGRDMALILDVARFKYPPHWVPLTLLWEAMNSIDEATGLHRGFMIISKHQEATSVLYTLSCRRADWVDIAKYLIDDVPLLLESENLSTICDVLSIIFTTLPAGAGEFMEWMAEVRRTEENGLLLSKEEKERLAAKEEVLHQVRQTQLYKYITETWASTPCLCTPASGNKESLPQIAASVCCQAAALLAGTGTSRGFCCSSANIQWLDANGDMPKTVVSSTVMANGNEHTIDMLVPTSPMRQKGEKNASCCGNGRHPDENDVLTVLLLALPPSTWSGIKQERLRKKFSDIVSTSSLPVVLREEVLHLQRQLDFLKKCKENKVDDDLYAVPF